MGIWKSIRHVRALAGFAALIGLLVLTGCGSSNGADATAEAIVLSGVAKSAENDQMLEMFKQQPEFKNMVACFARSLSDQGKEKTKDIHKLAKRRMG